MRESTGLFAKLLALGEEGQGQLLAQLLSSERVVQLLGVAMNSGEVARAAVEKGLGQIFKALSVPTLEDLHELESKLDELEALLAEISEMTQKLQAQAPAAPESTDLTATVARTGRRSRRRD